MYTDGWEPGIISQATGAVNTVSCGEFTWHVCHRLHPRWETRHGVTGRRDRARWFYSRSRHSRITRAKRGLESQRAANLPWCSRGHRSDGREKRRTMEAAISLHHLAVMWLSSSSVTWLSFHLRCNQTAEVNSTAIVSAQTMLKAALLTARRGGTLTTVVGKRNNATPPHR